MYVRLSIFFFLVFLVSCLPVSEGSADDAGAASQGAVLGSFNIQHLGWDTGRSYQGVARVVAKKDWVAIQELMNSGGMDRLHEQLESKTGEEWDYVYSTPQGRSTYQEKMAYLWRADQFELVGDAKLYPDSNDNFARPPYAAEFRNLGDDSTFVASTVHITYGSRIADRVPEIEAMGQSHWTWLSTTWPDAQYVVLGDFNLRATHEAFDPLSRQFAFLPIGKNTTLSTTDGEFANPYDHIWVSHDHDLRIESYGKIDFPARLSETDPDRYWSHEAARDYISDHAPVFFTINGQERPYPMKEGPVTVPEWVYSDDGEASESDECIDLNESSQDRLQDLPGIGPVYATAILESRPWSSIDELTVISGVGDVTVSNVRDSGLVCDEFI